LGDYFNDVIALSDRDYTVSNVKIEKRIHLADLGHLEANVAMLPAQTKKIQHKP